jgi:hypothetical protein
MSEFVRFPGDIYVAGNISSKTLSVPAGAVTDAAIQAGAGIAATKLQQQHRLDYSQPNTTATSETRIIYACRGASGTIIDFRAGSIGVAVGAATVTVDLRKNGTTVLTGVITLDTGNVARVAEVGTLSVTTLVAGDVLEVVLTATAGGGTLPTGVFVSATVHEDPA